jgi:predicted nucleotidyltransferase
MKVCAAPTSSARSNIRQLWNWRSNWKRRGNSYVTELNRLLLRLCDADLDFVIVGGFAATLHGSSLLTRDLDVCAVLTAENVGRLRDAFRELHPTHRHTPQRLSFLDTPEPGTPLGNLYLQTDLGPIDFLGSITGVGDFQQVRANAIEVELFAHRVRVIAMADLIRSKRALGREKDRLALKELLAVVEKSRPD